MIDNDYVMHIVLFLLSQGFLYKYKSSRRVAGRRLHITSWLPCGVFDGLPARYR